LVQAPSFSPNPVPANRTISFDTLPREYPDYGRSDYAPPAFEATYADGSSVTAASYVGHTIVEGCVSPQGLPSLRSEPGDEAHTLVISLADPLWGLEIDLVYCVLADYDIIARHTVFRNSGSRALDLERALSCSVDFFGDSKFELIHLYGGWAAERQLGRIPLGRSGHRVESRRGASSHEQNPFIALARPTTTEDYGDVYAMNLVYSGSFLAGVSVNSYEKTRLHIGLNPADFAWHLEPGHIFTTPQAVLAYSSRGLGGLSHILHQAYRERLARGPWQYKPRPILVNNWEATYFIFTQDRILQLIDASAELGIELFVLDDGWFGKRDDDTSGLGDWWCNEEKLPGGLTALASHAHEKGMLFGLWFEPEMVSPDSDLYRAHPNWCLQVPGRTLSQGRNQLVLDLGRKEVQDYLYESITAVLRSGSIDYIKWDMNRNNTEVGSAALPAERQKETAHRYICGLYDLLDRITGDFPQVLFESCAGGGGRFDPGMLYYTSQVWTSDNTDAYQRLPIQWGTSLAYPPLTMGAHVSSCPNHQVGRTTPLKTRGNVAMAANLGYELDLLNLSSEEKTEVARQISLYKTLRPTLQFGHFYRLLSPFERGAQGSTAWMFVSPDRSQVVVFYYLHLATVYNRFVQLRLRELDPSASYQTEAGEIYGGDFLMHVGLRLPELFGDFDSVVIPLKTV